MRVSLSTCRPAWLILGICLIAGQLPAQHMTPAERLMVGIWVRRCDAAPGVTRVPHSLFTFEPDWRYTNVAETTANTLTTATGTWSLTATHLLLNADTLVSAPIVWVSADLFYTTEGPDAGGASVFAYFQRVTGSLKRRLQLKPLLKKADKQLEINQ